MTINVLDCCWKPPSWSHASDGYFIIASSFDWKPLQQLPTSILDLLLLDIADDSNLGFSMSINCLKASSMLRLIGEGCKGIAFAKYFLFLDPDVAFHLVKYLSCKLYFVMDVKSSPIAGLDPLASGEFDIESVIEITDPMSITAALKASDEILFTWKLCTWFYINSHVFRFCTSAENVKQTYLKGKWTV